MSLSLPSTDLDLEHFKNALLVEAKTRIKYCIKVWKCLEYTQAHPETVDKIGAMWCSDKKHFLINSNILGEFLNVRPNTINTNFRDHCFEITTHSNAELQKENSNLHETRHWKKRINLSYSFTPTSTITEIESIPCMNERPSKVQDPKPLPTLAPSLAPPPNMPPNIMNPNYLTYSNYIMQTPVTQHLSTNPSLLQQHALLNQPQISMSHSNSNLNTFNSNLVNSSAETGNAIFTKFIPNEVQAFLSLDPSQLISIGHVRFEIEDINDEWFSKALLHAYHIWFQHFPNYTQASIHTLAEALIELSSISQNFALHSLISTNLAYIIGNVHHDEGSSQTEPDPMISFEQFFKFFVQFGSINDPLETLIEISANENYDENQSVQFKPWFTPSMDKIFILNHLQQMLLYNCQSEAWIIRPSKNLKKFSLIFKSTQLNDIAVYIYHDCVAPPEQRFSVKFENPENPIVYQKNFEILLQETLKLNFASINPMESNEEIEKPSYLTADTIVNRTPLLSTFPPQFSFDLETPFSQRYSQRLSQFDLPFSQNSQL